MVIAYLRISTGKQLLANQQDEISRFAKSKNLTVDRWVTETVSGRKAQKERKLGPVIEKTESRRHAHRHRIVQVIEDSHRHNGNNGALS